MHLLSSLSPPLPLTLPPASPRDNTDSPAGSDLLVVSKGDDRSTSRSPLLKATSSLQLPSTHNQLGASSKHKNTPLSQESDGGRGSSHSPRRSPLSRSPTPPRHQLTPSPLPDVPRPRRTTPLAYKAPAYSPIRFSPESGSDSGLAHLGAAAQENGVQALYSRDSEHDRKVRHSRHRHHRREKQVHRHRHRERVSEAPRPHRSRRDKDGEYRHGGRSRSDRPDSHRRR